MDAIRGTRGQRVLAAATAAAAAALALGAPVGAQAPAGPAELLPNLNEAIPGNIAVVRARTARGRVRPIELRFASQVDNLGTGPLKLAGSLPSRRARSMTTSQLISRVDGSTVTKARVGGMRFGRVTRRSQWQLLGLIRYELRRASDYALVRSSRGVGFCLDDSANPDRDTLMPGEPALPVFPLGCGTSHPELRSLTMGVSVGWGNAYPANFVGQSLDITRLPAGRYYLVHRANPSRALAESNYADNAASVLLELTRPRGALPKVSTLSSCSETDRCPLTPAPGPPPAG